MNSSVLDTLPGGIPKVIHRIWLGPIEPPEFVAFGERWAELHPDWRVITWRDWMLPALDNQSLFDRAASPAQRADILRLELLRRYGGVYVDTDMEPLRPLDELLADQRCVFGREDDRWVATGIVAAVPGDPFVVHLCSSMAERMAAKQSAPPNESLGPKWITSELEQRAPGTEGVTVYPPELFYPYHFTEPHRRNERFDHAYTVHHWAHSWADAS